MPDPTRNGRWGIRQCRNGEPTGGGTINLGWPTRGEAEAANPPRFGYVNVAFDRFPDDGGNRG